MVLKPTQAKQEWNKEIPSASLPSLEARIDHLLLTTESKGVVNIPQKEIDKILEEAIKPILKKYETAGWNVKWYSSHGGGGYQFTPKQEQPNHKAELT